MSELDSPFLSGPLALREQPASAPPLGELFEDESAFDRSGLAPELPSDARLLAELQQKKKLPGATALAAALKAMAKPKELERALAVALQSTPWESEKGSVELQLFLARLGAEAFVRGASVPEANRAQVGFIDHPSRLLDSASATQRVYFLHFACERLRRLAPSPEAPAEHQRWLAGAAALFRWFQGELRRDYQFTGMEKSLLLAYRRLSVALVWKHYQALFDHWLDQARRSRALAVEAFTVLNAALETAAITRTEDEEAQLSSFRYDARAYRDYFFVSPASDFPYSYFSVRAKASEQKPLQIAFSRLNRRRAEQWQYLQEVAALSTSDPLPSFRRSEAWQSWLAARWTKELQALPAAERLKQVVTWLQRYFELFTVHVPHNLREGCKEPSYLSRTFPRAVNGAEIHDCAVYVARWLHMLGALIDPKRPAQELTRIEIFLVEMPVHVGVMIRLRAAAKQELLISINNSSASVYDIEASETREESATRVISDVFLELTTPYLLHPLSASPRDAGALWRELCRRFEKRTVLPYASASEPHLRYLEYKAKYAGIASRLALHVQRSWNELREKLAAGKLTKLQMAVLLTLHLSDVRKMAMAATKEYDEVVRSVAQAVATDIEANRRKIPKAARFSDYQQVPPWERSVDPYRKAVEEAARQGKLASFRTEDFFPEDDFVAAVD